MKTLQIDRKRWLRGKPGQGCLLDEEDKMCCLGFYCKRLGFEDHFMNYISTPEGAFDCWISAKKPKERSLKSRIEKGSQLLKRTKYVNRPVENESIVAKLIDINDDTEITDEKREEKLKKLFSKVGIKVTFVG